MSLNIPSDVSNIIFEYYAQLKHLKWFPFIDKKTEKLKWKVNKYSAKYDNLNKLLKYKKNNMPHDISINMHILMENIIINRYNTIGTCTYLKTQHFINKNQFIIPISKLYIEFTDEFGFKNLLFCLITKMSYHRVDYDIYQDGIIHSGLIGLIKHDDTNYSLFIEKY